MDFRVRKQSKTSSLRTGEIDISHGKIHTPVFMPVGTVGAVKSVAPWELRDLGAEIILGNTYHLYLRPGEKLIHKFGGLAKYNLWNGPILTDSGGFQVFSLREKKFKILGQRPIRLWWKNLLVSPGRRHGGKFKIKEGDLFEEKSLIKISEDGVEFRSHLDGSKHFFPPEKVIDIQLALKSDIIMPLDVCPPSKSPFNEVKKAVELSIKWLRRSKIHLNNKQVKDKPALFGIVQGGIYPDLRKYCVQEMIKLDLPGYAIGGLAVGESQKEMLKIVALMGKILPKNKPRYLMGVGTPDDLIRVTKLGMDMFDCVLPTRMARHGVAYKLKSQNLKVKTKEGNLFEEINLNKSQYRTDKNPIDKNCQCPACRAQIKSNSYSDIRRSEAKEDKNKFSRAYISHLVREKEILGVRLLTLHNLWTYLELMRNIRKTCPEPIEGFDK